jgi:hypothetical protein
MSVRRAERSLQTLFSTAMDNLPQQRTQGRNSPPPRDVEGGFDGFAYASGNPEPMRPPKLQGAGCASKLLLCSVCCLCLAVTLLAGLAVLSLPVVEQTQGAVAASLRAHAFLPSSLAREPREPPPEREPRAPRARPLPAVLRRFALVRRAAAPQHGADLESLQRSFPSWGAPPNWSLDDFVRDASLALAAVAERLGELPPAELERHSASPGQYLDL